MFWIFVDWLERFGVEAGFIIVMLPIIYDLLGIIYGRDPAFKIGFVGVVTQICGAVCMGLGKYCRYRS